MIKNFLKFKSPKFDVVIGDEAQDLSFDTMGKKKNMHYSKILLLQVMMRSIYKWNHGQTINNTRHKKNEESYMELLKSFDTCKKIINKKIKNDKTRIILCRCKGLKNIYMI